MKWPAKISLVLGFIFVALIVWAAAPPPGTYIVPSFFTTNAAKIIGTNGIGVSSNTVNGTYFIDGSGVIGSGSNVLTIASNNVILTASPTQVDFYGFTLMTNSNNKVSIGAPTGTGSGATNIFNPNQFTQIGTGGTNVNISSGALLTNITLYENTFVDNYIGDLATALSFWRIAPDGSAYFAAGSILFNPDGNVTNLSVATAAITNRSLTVNSLIKSGAALQEASILNGQGALTNNGAGTFGWFPNYITGSVVSNNFHPKFSVWSNGTEVVALGGTTNFDFYGFTLFTNASGKVSIGALASSSATTNTFDATQFLPNGAGGTNITIAGGSQQTNNSFYGILTARPTNATPPSFKFFETNGTGYSEISAPKVIATNNTLFLPTNGIQGVLASVRQAAGTNQMFAIPLGTGALTNNGLGGQYGWFNGFASTADLTITNELINIATNNVRVKPGTAITITTNYELSGVTYTPNLALAFASNNVVLTSSPTQVDFYGFTSVTQASGKISIGAPSGSADGLGFSLQTNAFGQNVGGATNLLFLTDGNISIRATNTTTGGSTNTIALSLPRPLVDPFIVIDNVGIYPTNPWINLVHEEFQGDATSTTLGAMGQNPWFSANTGSTVTRRAPILGLGAPHYLSVQTTNAGVAGCYGLGGAASVPNGVTLTNYEVIYWSRIMLSRTNTTGEVTTTRVGFSDKADFTTTDANNGAWMMVNTNVATNSFILTTARSGVSTRTFSQHGSNTLSALTWVNVGIWLDSTGTNFIGIIGLTRTNMTTIMTNTAASPASASLVGPFINVTGVAGAGNVLRTNYVDNFEVWVRPLTANY